MGLYTPVVYKPFILLTNLADNADAKLETMKEILAAAKKAFRGAYGAAEISKWLDVFFRRFLSQAFKRNCAPDGVPVFSVYLSPSAWHVPSDISGQCFR